VPLEKDWVLKPVSWPACGALTDGGGNCVDGAVGVGVGGGVLPPGRRWAKAGEVAKAPARRTKQPKAKRERTVPGRKIGKKRGSGRSKARAWRQAWRWTAGKIMANYTYCSNIALRWAGVPLGLGMEISIAPVVAPPHGQQP
jgi:hypothetical protein